MDVILLVGGKATRLRSVLGDNLPKCLADINGTPFIKYQLDLINDRIEPDKIILALGRLSDEVINYIERIKSEYKFKILYSVEHKPLGTGGAIKLALTHTNECDIIIMNGDVYNDIDFVEFENKSKYGVNIALTRVYNTDRYGVVSTKGQTISRWGEKHYIQEGLINRGVYNFYEFNRSIFDYFPDSFSFETDLMPYMIAHNQAFAVEMPGYFIDIGIESDYKKFCNYIKL